MKNTESKKLRKKFNIFIVLVNLILILCSYKMMPMIQNYPPNSENMAFQKSVEQFSHVEQYIIIFVVMTGLHIFALNKLLKRVFRFLNKYENNESITYDEIKEVRKDCINIPYKFYIVQMIIVIILGMSLTFLLISDGLAILKFFLMMLAITSLIEIIQFIVIQRNLKAVMIKTYEKDGTYEKNIGLRLRFSVNLILQIIPFISVSIIIISLIGYAKATKLYAQASANYYEAYLNNQDINRSSISEIKDILQKIPLKNKDDYFFILSDNYNNQYVSKAGTKISDFFIKYLDFYFKGDKGIVYEFYGTEQQAYTVKINDNLGNTYYIGFEYSTADYDLMNFFLAIIAGALIVYTLFISVIARNIANNIENVSNLFKEILENSKIRQADNLPILSNDEIGDLSYYYNRINELTQSYEKELKSNEYVMQRQAQFAILGEFAGGIAHDLNSPLSALKLDISTLKKYINSDKISAEQDIRDTLIEMLNNIQNSLEKMGKTISSVRDQIRSTGDTEKELFKVRDLVEGVEILFGSILRKSNCQLINNVSEEYEIKGEKNKLDRVIGNIVKNSLDAYQDRHKNGQIEVDMTKTNDKYIISIKDYAGGIPEEIQGILFKEMKTTKQENGTGFGLYYSNTIIESSFNGKINFTSEKDVGTTFNIEIPINREEN